jgi:hypothetical protein
MIFGGATLEADLPLSLKRSRWIPGECRGERLAALDQAKRMGKSITMAKLCQG